MVTEFKFLKSNPAFSAKGGVGIRVGFRVQVLGLRSFMAWRSNVWVSGFEEFGVEAHPQQTDSGAQKRLTTVLNPES